MLDGADPLALLIAGYGVNVVPKVEPPPEDDDQLEEGVTAEQVAAEANAWTSVPDFRMRDNY